MISPPDPLFRDAMEHYRKSPPPSAWSRIESGLNHKQPKYLWRKIAASILLLLAVGFLFWPKDKIAPSTTFNQKSTQAPELKDETNANLSTESPIVTEKHLNNTNQESNVRSRSNKINEQHRIQKTASEMQVVTEAVPEKQNIISSSEQPGLIPEANAGNKEVSSIDLPAPIVTFNSKRIKIVYTAEEVNTKYLKQDHMTQATPEKKNTSGIQKALDLAFDFKFDEGIYGDLRQKKNELLTLSPPEKKQDSNK